MEFKEPIPIEYCYYALLYSIETGKAPEVAFHKLIDYDIPYYARECMEKSVKALRKSKWSWKEIAYYLDYSSDISLLTIMKRKTYAKKTKL